MVSDSPDSTTKAPLLEVHELQTHFFTEDGVVKAVNGINLQVYKGEILGLVGESGSGKSVTGLSILRLVDKPGEIVGGEILFDGRSLLDLSDNEMVNLRGSQISMIFQQPLTSINPVLTLGSQISETLRVHNDMGKQESWDRAIELLRAVGIPDPERRAKSYPHEISGGQAQRVMIAMALALNPVLLIADEPTTALDVTIQAQILDLILNITDQYDMSVILVTHDLGVIAEMADRVSVMYAGHLVEQANVLDLFDRPLHPYTQGLIASVPVLGERKPRLEIIPGTVPKLIDLPDYCRFASRCRARLEYKLSICTESAPDMIELEPGHYVRCWLYQSAENHEAPLTIEMADSRPN
ncbi:MAG: ABC transporter ATP-binding protein [Anaerolineales bacterium]|nr:ABC transporter ATP-binding protein [Anaerolineales bacterium]